MASSNRALLNESTRFEEGEDLSKIHEPAQVPRATASGQKNPTEEEQDKTRSKKNIQLG